nr:nucleotide-binding alpha-beta plait domain-containing protein [Tanacetum cinerariifolium]
MTHATRAIATTSHNKEQMTHATRAIATTSHIKDRDIGARLKSMGDSLAQVISALQEMVTMHGRCNSYVIANLLCLWVGSSSTNAFAFPLSTTGDLPCFVASVVTCLLSWCYIKICSCNSCIHNPYSRLLSGLRMDAWDKNFIVLLIHSNLCTLWMGSHHLHANVARFQRPPAVNSGGYTHQN